MFRPYKVLYKGSQIFILDSSKSRKKKKIKIKKNKSRKKWTREINILNLLKLYYYSLPNQKISRVIISRTSTLHTMVSLQFPGNLFISYWLANLLMYVFSAAAAAKSLQSYLTLCDPTDGSHQAPPSLGISRQEHWSGLPFPSPMHESEK